MINPIHAPRPDSTQLAPDLTQHAYLATSLSSLSILPSPQVGAQSVASHPGRRAGVDSKIPRSTTPRSSSSPPRPQQALSGHRGGRDPFIPPSPSKPTDRRGLRSTRAPTVHAPRDQQEGGERVGAPSILRVLQPSQATLPAGWQEAARWQDPPISITSLTGRIASNS